VKKHFSRFIAIICLFIYLLFGFLNSGNIGFCLGDNSGSHFGIVFAGYETCCHNDKSEINHKHNQTTFGCECNDIDVDSVLVSQVLFNFSDFIHNIENVFASGIQFFVYNLTVSKNEIICCRKAPPDFLFKNSQIIKNSIILLI
jgi:hypothetical protein